MVSVDNADSILSHLTAVSMCLGCVGSFVVQYLYITNHLRITDSSCLKYLDSHDDTGCRSQSVPGRSMKALT